MKKVLLVYPPFCTPASPPYSLASMYSFLKSNCCDQICVLDLNLSFHIRRFGEYQKYFQKGDWDDYDKKTKKYVKESSKAYSDNNNGVVKGGRPEQIDEMLNLVRNEKPDIVAFSIVYSSQAFYAYAMLKELKEVVTVVGGPAVSEKVRGEADLCFGDAISMLDLLEKNEEMNWDSVPDFSGFKLQDYFTPEPVIPIKTSSTCYYKGCSFCTHYNHGKYREYDLSLIKKTVVDSGKKHFFLIDDMISPKRLCEISEIFKPLGVKWTCQLRPTKDFDEETLKIAADSGCVSLMWGVESGNDRILGLIEKGTNFADIQKVLKTSHEAGIRNIAYILFGFPSETKEEFLETVRFLRDNSEYIDLVSTSIFGLQKGSRVYENPDKYGIKIHEIGRTVLEPRVTYDVKSGLSQEDATKLRQRYKKTIEGVNKFPKRMNYFREHMFFFMG